MTIGLNPSRVAEVDILTAPPAANGRNFGHLLLVGDSPFIDMTTRIIDFSSIGDVAAMFGTTAPEYLAASVFFAQSPQPTYIKIGRWASTATKAVLHGATLTSAQQELSNFLGIGSGSFTISIDGTPQNIINLTLYSATNLNSIASTITAALSGAVCTWDSVNSRFDITSSSTGAGAKAFGYISFIGYPADGNTFTINGTTLTLKTSGATGAQVNIGVGAAETMAAIVAYFAAHPIAGINITQTDAATALVQATTIGTAGNAKTLAKVGANLNVSAATLTGGTNASSVSFATTYGSGTDISALLGLTSSQALTPIPGYSAETPVAAVAAMADMSVDWYALYICATPCTDDQEIDVAAYIEAAAPSRIYGTTVQSSLALSGTDTTNLGYRLKTGNYRRTFWQYSSSNAYAGISLAGRSATIDYSGVNTTITFKFKQEPGITAETLLTSQANNLEAINGNVFVNYSNGVAIVEQGVMANGVYIDEVIGYDWLQNQLQVGRFNVFLSNTKIPQTDDGMNILFASDTQVLEAARRNGFIAPGQWNAQGFGELNNGDLLAKGYYIYATPMRLQSQADRSARKAPLTQIAVKLAGAIHSCVIQVSGNR